jgi:endonuclease YncB( thermonuclease family)
MRLHPSREDLAALAFVLPLAALAGYVAAHKLAEPAAVAVPGGYDLVGPVTHVRDGDTIEVNGVPVRIANLDCAELGTPAGESAKALMRSWASRATASCTLEGRQSYDREVGVCSIEGHGDVGEAMIRAGACRRW